MPIIASGITAYNTNNRLRVQLLDNATKAIVYDEQIFVAPHVNGHNFVLNAPTFDVYYIRLQEEVAANIWNTIGNYEKDVTENCTTVEQDLELYVNGGRANLDPVANTSSVDIPALAGRIYRLVEEGTGQLIHGVEWQRKDTGGFDLLGGQVFQAQTSYFVQFFPPGTTADEDIVIRVGSNDLYAPAVGTNQYRNPNLAGAVYRVVQRGYGPLTRLINAEIAIVPAGGFDLLGGQLFGDKDIFFVQVYPKVCITQTNGSNAAFAGEVEILNDTVYNAAHQNKLIVFRGAGQLVKYTLPDINAFPQQVIIAFEANGGNQVYGTIETFAAGQYIDYKVPNQLNTTRLALAQGEQVWLCRGGNNKWRVVNSSWAYNNGLGTDLLSTLPAPGYLAKDGSIYSKQVFWRIWDAVQEAQPFSPIVTDAVWNTVDPVTGLKLNSGFYADVDANNFRLPDERNYYGRATDGAKLPGAKETDQVGEHSHALPADI
ncbi:MAG: hypothetical protein SFU21_10880, partial [Flavihumibacter sp.]|nr:hypothetical protein [Flavihumibacter sp.]